MSATITRCQSGRTVDTWFDRSSRNWITQIKDMECNQVGDAEFSGRSDSAKLTHAAAVAREGGASRLQWVTCEPNPAVLIEALRNVRAFPPG